MTDMENMTLQENGDGKAVKGTEIRRTHRVGSVTCGLILVLYGILFMVHIVSPKLKFYMIFELWPLILVFLGVEILISCTRENQKKSKVVYDFPAVLLIFIVAIFAMVMSGINFYYDYYNTAYSSEGGVSSTVETISGSEVFSAENVNSVCINNELWDVKVMPSDNNDIRVSYNGNVWGNKNAVQLNKVQNDIVMDITGAKNMGYMPFNFGRDERGEVTLYLPETDTIALKIQNDYSYVRIQGISCGELALGNDYGKVELEDIKCKNLTYNNDSGDMKLKDISCDGLTLTNDYGKVELADISCSSFDFDNDSGNIKIENSACGDFSLNNGYGSLKVDNTSFAGFALKNDSGDVTMRKLTAKDTDINTKYGSIEVGDSSMEACRMDTENGNLTFNNVSAASMNIDSEFGTVSLKNVDSSTETNISSDSGNVYIRYKDKPEDLSFDVKSSYGNIKADIKDALYDYNLDTAKKGVVGSGSHNVSIVTEYGNITLE